MTARQRLHPRNQNSHAKQPARSDRYYDTPRNFPVVSLAEAQKTGTRSDTLFAAANYHARHHNWPIANRLREVATALKVA